MCRDLQRPIYRERELFFNPWRTLLQFKTLLQGKTGAVDHGVHRGDPELLFESIQKVNQPNTAVQSGFRKIDNDLSSNTISKSRSRTTTAR